jgi:dimethylsulfone monooxygenase
MASHFQEDITGSRTTCFRPKPLFKPRPTIYAGGESAAAKDLIARKCDAYLMHGDPAAMVGEKIADMRARRAQNGLPPMSFGVAGYAIMRETEKEAKAERESPTFANRPVDSPTISNG